MITLALRRPLDTTIEGLRQAAGSLDDGSGCQSSVVTRSPTVAVRELAAEELLKRGGDDAIPPTCAALSCMVMTSYMYTGGLKNFVTNYPNKA